MEKITDIISNIKVQDDVLTFINELEEGYFEYLRLLESYGEDFILLYLSAYRELELVSTLEINSGTSLSAMFHRKITRGDSIMKAIDWIKHDYTLSTKGLHAIHKEVMKNDNRNYLVKGKFRKDPAAIGSFMLDEAGEFAKDENGEKIGIVKYLAPPAEEVPQMMQEVLDFFNNEMDINEQLRHPYLQSAVAHALVVHVQPYMDGNARTARVLHHVKLWQHAYENLGINISAPALYLSGDYMFSRSSYRGKIDLINDNVLNNEAWNVWLNYNLSIIYGKLGYLTNEIALLKRMYDTSKRR